MRPAGSLVLLAGAAQALAGIAALAGVSGLEANVVEIESSEDFGRLYLSLGAWGLISLALGVGEVLAGAAALRSTPNGRMAALIAAYLGLAGAFFTLAIFRWASVALIVAQLLAIFLLSYRGSRRSSG
jgi:hypothetical protein